MHCVRMMRAILRAIPVLSLALSTFAGPARADLAARQAAMEKEIAALHNGSPVSLAQCIKVATIGSSAVGIAEESVEVAHKQILAAKGAWLPNLTLSGNWTRNQRKDYDADVYGTTLLPANLFDVNGVPLQINGVDPYSAYNVPVGTSDQTTLQTFRSVTAQSNLMVFDGFSRIAGMKAADATLASNEATLDYQNELLVQNVSVAYYNLLRAKQGLDVAAESEDLAKKELDRSQTYFDLGIATKSDVLQARVRYEQTRLESVRARNLQRQAFVDLAHLMNIPGTETFEIEDASVDPSTVEIPKLQELYDQAKASRADLQAARHDVDASDARVTQAKSALYPQVSIFGQLSRSTQETPFRFGAATNQSMAWGISGDWNLFDRFQTKLNKQQALADRRRSEYTLHQSELDAQKEIVQLLNSLIEAKEQYAVAAGTIEEAQENLRLANERFKVGAGTSLDVINAQVNLTQARTDAIDAQTAFLIARAQLARATGAPQP